MFSGRRVVNFCAALVVGIMTWGVVGGVSAAPILSAAGSPTTTIALANTTTTTVRSDSTTTTVKPDTTTTLPIRDLCPNIAGVQTTVPAGFFVNAEGNCARIVDLCPNIDGVQTTIPTGMFVNVRGDCVPRVADLCPNIPGVQATIPTGMIVNAAGNCVRIVDLCSNIPGIQATVPSGMFRTANGKCFPRVVDVIVIGPNPAISPCEIGTTGPGGGIVFYDAGSHQPWGRCLEAAPNTWNGSYAAPAYVDPDKYWGCQGMSIPGASGTAIGTGRANTTAIVNACATSGIAARLADNLVFGGKSDWFLPSKEELVLMNTERTIIGGLVYQYWSSTEINANRAFFLHIGPGTLYSGSKGNLPINGQSSAVSVRPIRAYN